MQFPPCSSKTPGVQVPGLNLGLEKQTLQSKAQVVPLNKDFQAILKRERLLQKVIRWLWSWWMEAAAQLSASTTLHCSQTTEKKREGRREEAQLWPCPQGAEEEKRKNNTALWVPSLYKLRAS